jgi:hypothetical protein
LLGAGALIATAAELRQPTQREGSAPDATPGESINTTLMLDAAGCAGARSTVWNPLSGVEYTGRLRITLPAQRAGALVLYIGDTMPLEFDAINTRDQPIPMALERLVAGPGMHVPPDFWLDDGSPVDAPTQIAKVTIDALADRERDIRFALGRRAPRVLARLIGYPATTRAPICAERMGLGEIYFATGWQTAERDPVEGEVRVMRERGAVLVSSVDGLSSRIRVRLAPATAGPVGGLQLAVRVNDFYDVPPMTLEDGYRDYEWTVPDAAWVRGTNELLFTVSHTSGSAASDLRLAVASLYVH